MGDAYGTLAGVPGVSLANYKGAFATLAALQLAYATGTPGWFAYVGPDKYEWNPATNTWESPFLNLTAESGEVILPGTYANAAGRQWLNDTNANITVPSVATAANMTAAGLTDVTGTSETWADPATVANNTAMLALAQLSKCYVRVYNTAAAAWFMQIAQPPSTLGNWLQLTALAAVSGGPAVPGSSVTPATASSSSTASDFISVSVTATGLIIFAIVVHETISSTLGGISFGLYDPAGTLVASSETRVLLSATAVQGSGTLVIPVTVASTGTYKVKIWNPGSTTATAGSDANGRSSVRWWQG